MTSKVSLPFLLACVAAALLWQTPVTANHPVIVEGNCMGASGADVPTACGDYDGDGRTGADEDIDSATDRVFGTINGALGVTNGGANQNGRVLIVASGLYVESVLITAANGNVVLEAAPGVDANIDAVQQGALGNTERQAMPGIVVNAPENRFVVIRNVNLRNWATGIEVHGQSRLSLEKVRLDGNLNFGIEVRDSARVSVAGSEVSGTGRRSSASNVPSVPSPGNGIDFADGATGTVFGTSVTHSFGIGITGSGACVDQVNVFGNARDLFRVKTCSLPR